MESTKEVLILTMRIYHQQHFTAVFRGGREQGELMQFHQNQRNHLDLNEFFTKAHVSWDESVEGVYSE